MEQRALEEQEKRERAERVRKLREERQVDLFVPQQMCKVKNITALRITL